MANLGNFLYDEQNIWWQTNQDKWLFVTNWINKNNASLCEKVKLYTGLIIVHMFLKEDVHMAEDITHTQQQQQQQQYISRVSCQKGPICLAWAWRVGPFWQDTVDMIKSMLSFKLRCCTAGYSSCLWYFNYNRSLPWAVRLCSLWELEHPTQASSANLSSWVAAVGCKKRCRCIVNKLKLGQNGCHFAENIFKSISFVQLTICQYWLSWWLTGEKAITIIWTSDDFVYWCIYATMG